MLNGSSGTKHPFTYQNTRELDVYSLGLADNSATVIVSRPVLTLYQKGKILGANMKTLHGSLQELKILDPFSSLTQQDIKLEIKV